MYTASQTINWVTNHTPLNGVHCGCGAVMRHADSHYTCTSWYTGEYCGARRMHHVMVELEVMDRLVNCDVRRIIARAGVGEDASNEIERTINQAKRELLTDLRASLIALGAQIIIINQYVQVELSLPTSDGSVVRLIVV